MMNPFWPLFSNSSATFRIFEKCPDILIHFCFWVKHVMFLKELNLSDFSPVIKPGIKIGKNMLTIAAHHIVKGLAASLGLNDRIGGPYCCKIVCSGLTTGAE